jgi:hypothetical protein
MDGGSWAKLSSVREGGAMTCEDEREGGAIEDVSEALAVERRSS